jgi:hypothetical protein
MGDLWRLCGWLPAFFSTNDFAAQIKQSAGIIFFFLFFVVLGLNSGLHAY